MTFGTSQCHSGVKTFQLEMKNNLINPQHRTYIPSSLPEKGEEIFHHPFRRRNHMNIPKLFANQIFPITPYDGTQETFTHT
jgi:hypothetical protein